MGIAHKPPTLMNIICVTSNFVLWGVGQDTGMQLFGRYFGKGACILQARIIATLHNIRLRRQIHFLGQMPLHSGVVFQTSCDFIVDIVCGGGLSFS